MAADLSEQTDQQLLKLFQQSGDPDAFAVLVQRHHGMIYGVANRMLNCSHAAEDVVQATFLVLAKDAAKVRKRTALASWLYGIAFRISARLANQRAKLTASPLDNEVMVSDDPLQRLSEQFEQNTVFEELHQLPERVRTAMVLRYLQGKSNAEVADELSLSESAVEGRLKRGRNQLRLRLARQGVAFTVGVAVLNAIKNEAAAAEVPQLVAKTVEACSAAGATVGGDAFSNEVFQLAEQEMMKMFTTKLISNAWVATLTVGVLAAGWSLAGNSLLLAQGDDPFGDSETTADEIEVDPFGADPFGATTAQKPNAPPTTFKSSRSKPATGTRPGGDDPFAEDSKPSLSQRMRSLGQYGIGNETESEVRILEVLSKEQTELEFNQEPLETVMAIISERHNIQIAFDRRALADENIDPSSDPVDLSVSKVRLQSALNLVLRDLNLAWVVRDEVLMITTIEASEEMVETRLYAIASHWPLTPEELMKTVTTTVAPDSWSSVGGPGAISLVNGGLFVSNTHEVHLEVSKIFGQLDKLYAGSGKTNSNAANQRQ